MLNKDALKAAKDVAEEIYLTTLSGDEDSDREIEAAIEAYLAALPDEGEVRDALRWALGFVRSSIGRLKPDDPDWNDYKRARELLGEKGQ